MAPSCRDQAGRRLDAQSCRRLGRVVPRHLDIGSAWHLVSVCVHRDRRAIGQGRVLQAGRLRAVGRDAGGKRAGYLEPRSAGITLHAASGAGRTLPPQS